MCPECGSHQVTIHEFDFGVCPQTGYHDAGERFHCRECGAAGEPSELEPAISHENSKARPERAGQTLGPGIPLLAAGGPMAQSP